MPRGLRAVLAALPETGAGNSVEERRDGACYIDSLVIDNRSIYARQYRTAIVGINLVTRMAKHQAKSILFRKDRNGFSDMSVRLVIDPVPRASKNSRFFCWANTCNLAARSAIFCSSCL